jgi:hypothetical protein
MISASSSASLGAFAGTNLKSDILNFEANPDSSLLAYVAADGSKFSIYTQPWLAGRSGTERKVFTSSIASWRIFPLTDGRLIIAEKAHDNAPGYAYEIRSNGRLAPLVRAAPGLTFLPQSGTGAIIFGSSANNQLKLYAQNGATTLELPIKTVADKCVWSPYRPATRQAPATDIVVYCAVPSDSTAHDFIKNWYMGALHTSDSWWRINLTSGKSEEIFSAGSGSSRIDVVDPTIDTTGSILGFKNGIDGTLWVLRVVK